MKKLLMGLSAVVIVTAVTPVFAEDWSTPKVNWKDVSHDLKDLRADYKDLRQDRAAFAEALKSGTLTPAQARADIADIRHDKMDIRKDIRELRHDGIVVKGTHR